MKDTLKKASDIDRRSFLTHTAKTFLGVSAVPMMIGNESRAASGAGLNLPLREKPAQRVIYLYMSGGMSHLDTFDPKPGHDNAGPVKPIATVADHIQLSEYLPTLADHTDKMAIIRSMTSTAGAHSQGNYYMHTSYQKRASIRHPGVGAWKLKMHGRVNQQLPGSVYVGGGSTLNGGAGFFESKYEPLAINSPEAGLRNSKRLHSVSEELFDHRRQLSAELDAEFRATYDTKQTRAHTSMYDDAVRIMKSSDLNVFDLKREDDAVRDLYGRNSFGQGCLLARRLIEKQVRAVEVSLGGWDTHANNFETVPVKCRALDQALAALLSDLEHRNLLQDTLVVLATEFGRTPIINGNAGRDHFPRAFSTMLAGGGIKGGTVYGKTSDGGERVEGDPVKIPDFNATIAHTLGISLDEIVYSPTKRPFTVADKGKPILDILT